MSRPAWSEMSDEELAAHCMEKLDGAMEELLQRYERRVHGCAHRMALDRDEVEDLAQEIFLRVLGSLSRFEGSSAFATWFYRLAHNTCVDNFRRGTRQRTHRTGRDDQDLLEELLSDDNSEGWGNPESQLEHDLASCYVGWLLSTLSPGNRRVIQLRLLDGRSTEDVARLLDTTPDGVKSRLRRARAQLRAIAEDDGVCPLFCGYRYVAPAQAPSRSDTGSRSR
ncbi:MAG: RNA polymerase sigma factor [Acidimicrobiales bacterium]